MPLHPAAAAILPLLKEGGLELTPGTSPQQARARMEAGAANPALPRHPVHAVEDRTIPGPAGPLPVRVYRPSAASGLPVLVWFHGGGWVLCSLDTHDNLCRMLCDDTDAVVVSVGYRLAPEAKFPAALDDCVAAFEWVIAHADEVGGDGARVAIGGDSAGGNLAAAAALVLRDRSGPQPRAQVLVYPVTDFEFSSASMLDNATGYGLEAEHMRWFFDQYARTPDDVDDWRMSPLRAPDVANLPPTVVVTAEFDVLRDQGEAYGRRLQEAGVPVNVVRCDGVFHGFFGLHAFIEPATDPWDRAVGLLRESLESGVR